MTVPFHERGALADEFASVVTMSPERITEMHNRIQAAVQAHPELTALCRLGRSMEVRRLREVSWRYWNTGDWSNAQAVLDLVTQFRAHTGPEYALALAVLGVESSAGSDELQQALRLLEQPYSEQTASAVLSPTRPERKSGRNK